MATRALKAGKSGSVVADWRSPGVGAPEHWYSMFGFEVASDFPLPLPEQPPGSGGPDWLFVDRGTEDHDTRAPLVGGESYLDGQAVVRREEDGAWIWYRGVGKFRIAAESRLVDVYAEPGASERVLGLVLAGQISVFLLHRLGFPTLHASAVVAERGAVAFLGRWGQGKSTMTAAFLRRGATLLTDDVLPVRIADDGVLCGPGLPLMKLWPEAARRALGLSEALPDLVPQGAVPGYDKKLVALGGAHDYAESPARLAAMYVLKRYDPESAGTEEITIRRLAGHLGLVAVLEHVSEGSFLTSAEAGRFLPTYVQAIRQAPVRLLTYPSGFERLEAVLQRVLQDMSGGEGEDMSRGGGE